MKVERRVTCLVKMAVLAIALFSVGNVSSQSLHSTSETNSIKKSTGPPNTIDELIISLRDQLDSDFLCWEESAIEQYWNIKFFSRNSSGSQPMVEKKGSFQEGAVSRPLDKYRIMSRELLRDGKLYRGVVVRFDRLAQENPEISHIRLVEIFGTPSVQRKTESDMAPPPPGQEPVEIKRQGNFQNMYMEWSNISPDVIVSATTGFRSQLYSLLAVKKFERGCK